MRSRRFIPMVDGLPRRIAPSAYTSIAAVSSATPGVLGAQVSDPSVAIFNTVTNPCTKPIEDGAYADAIIV